MATYLEIRGLVADEELNNRIQVAVVMAAHALLKDSPTAAEENWAVSTMGNPASEAKTALAYVLADCGDLTVEQIKEATDAEVQTCVDALVPSLVAHGEAVIGVQEEPAGKRG